MYIQYTKQKILKKMMYTEKNADKNTLYLKFKGKS